MTKTDCKKVRERGGQIDAKTSPKAVSEKAQTVVSENRCTSSKIDVFWSHFIASSVNWKQSAGVISGKPVTTYLRYSLAVSPSVYMFFSLRLSVQLYLSYIDC